METAVERTRSVSAPQPRPVLVPGTLDDLLTLDGATLGALYAQARVPDISKIHGDLRGRMLAIPSFPGPLAAIARGLAGSDVFPWRGKSFWPKDALHGEGKNRVILDRWKLFRFETFVAKSRAGDFDAVQLDYDKPENPFFIRAIKDEIRELSEGLYLGQAYIEAFGRPPVLGLYFGLAS